MPRPYRSRPNTNSRGGRGGRPQGHQADDPILMGEPSPALSKISQMNTVKLREHIKKMTVEAEQIKVKIEKLNQAETPNEQKIAELTKHRQRLAALCKVAAERLIGKLERAKQYHARGGSR